MPGRLLNKAALITDAGLGIGLETSLLFASKGANVLLVDINIKTAESVTVLIATRYPNVKAIAIKVDVWVEQEIKDAVGPAVKEFGRLDIMFNNAGIMHPVDDNALNTEAKIWDLTTQTNAKGVWWRSKYTILAMRENKADPEKRLTQGGSVINTASFIAIMDAATPQLVYTASKGVVLAMTGELAMVHAREGIRFNFICPWVFKGQYHFGIMLVGS